jgi:purine catabolism regulator
MDRHGLVRFEDLKVERVLAQIPMTRLTEDYIAMAVSPLETEPELLKTLETFLEHGGNKVATAAAIPLHRSSLAYRLEKISTLLGVDIDEPETRLELWIALRLRRIFMLANGDNKAP